MLVVVSIAALLTAILLPTLQRAPKQARATVRRAYLHQWGILFDIAQAGNTDGPADVRTACGQTGLLIRRRVGASCVSGALSRRWPGMGRDTAVDRGHTAG